MAVISKLLRASNIFSSSEKYKFTADDNEEINCIQHGILVLEFFFMYHNPITLTIDYSNFKRGKGFWKHNS